MSRIDTTHLINDLAVLQGENYLLLVEQDVIKIPGDWTTGTPRGDVRDNTADENGLLYAQWQFEESVFDGTDTVLHPYLDATQTINLPATKYKEGQTPSVKKCLVTDFEIELPSGVVGKTPPYFVQVVGEVTRDGASITPLTEDFYLDRENHTGTQLAATISDFDVAVENNSSVTANTNSRHNAVTVVNNSDVALQLTDQELSASIVNNSITIGKLNEEISASLVLANNALQPGEIGVTIQPYSVGTVIDPSYVATEENYTTVEKNKLSGIENNATADQTAEEILTAIKTVDGTGSGLDADTLDGQHASAFATAEQGELAVSAVQPVDIANFETTTQLNARDVANRLWGNLSNIPLWITNATAFGQSLVTAASASAVKTLLSLTKADVGLSNVDNTNDASKPISNATQTVLNLKANINNPTFTGNALILPNNTRINGVEHFYQTAKPTIRGDGSALVIGDRWWKTNDGTIWFWNGTYWLSTTINRYVSGYNTFTSSGALFVISAAPRRGFCESLRVNWNQLGGGGTNNWSPTAYYSLSVNVRNNDNSSVVELGSSINTVSATGSGVVNPNIVWDFADARVFAMRTTAKVNDAVNGQAMFFAEIRGYIP